MTYPTGSTITGSTFYKHKCTSSIRDPAINNPGRMPPINKPPIEVEAVTPKITIGRLGGMMGPTVDEAAVIAQEKSSSYPALRIASISMVHRPPASATAAPLIPAKIRLAITFACPNPP